MDDTWTDDTPLSRTRDVVPPTEIELETGHDVLQAAIDAQKQGRRVSELWDALLAVCRLNDIAVNRLVRDHSDTIAQAYPKLDLYDYRDFIQIKLKEHEYLLHALYDGGCFTNRKLDLETYVTLFENEERLVGVSSVATFLGNPRLKNVIRYAGDQIQADWETDISVEMTSNIDRFFAVVQESPQFLAQGIRVHCPESTENPENAKEHYEAIQGLFELASTMITAVRAKRHDLQIRYQRDRLLANIQNSDWLIDVRFHEMWDSLLYASTQQLANVTQTGFSHPLAKSLAMLSIRIGQICCEVRNEGVRNEHLDGSLFVQISDKFAIDIVNSCFGQGKNPKADQDVFRELIHLCKLGRCFAAMYLLLYVCLEDLQQLYQLMMDWQILDDDEKKPFKFAHTVFQKWLESGEPAEMEHLLKGPKRLDPQLAEFLESANRLDLAVQVKVRMGNIKGAKTTILSKGGNLDDNDIETLYLLSCCENQGDEDWRRDSYLQLKLNNICRKFNFYATSRRTVPVLHELLYMMNHSPTYLHIESALDIFIYERQDFVTEKAKEWKTIWNVLAGFMKIDETAFEGEPKYYGNQDFLILQKACDKLQLSIAQRTDVFEEMRNALSERFRRQGIEEIPIAIREMILTALELTLSIPN